MSVSESETDSESESASEPLFDNARTLNLRRTSRADSDAVSLQSAASAYSASSGDEDVEFEGNMRRRQPTLMVQSHEIMPRLLEFLESDEHSSFAHRIAAINSAVRP